MPPSAPAGGQTTNDSSGSPPDVPTVQDAGQAMMPARPEGVTAPLPVPTEVASSPMPASASQPTSSPAVALLPTGPTQSSVTPVTCGRPLYRDTGGESACGSDLDKVVSLVLSHIKAQSEACARHS